jgi:hypothetical protein
MQPMFEALLGLVAEPAGQGVTRDDSVLLIYPPANELDFREELLERFAPRVRAVGVPHRLVDVTGLVFEGLDEDTIASLCVDEFRDYRWMLQGLSQRVERTFEARLRAEAAEVPGGIVVAYATAALYPLVRFGELLARLRGVQARIALAFPGEDRSGRLHFIGQPNDGNYLAVRLDWA